MIWIPVALVAASFVGYCWWDIAQQLTTQHLPKWAWAAICAISVPLGGVIYLAVGRAPATKLTDADLYGHVELDAPTSDTTDRNEL